MAVIGLVVVTLYYNILVNFHYLPITEGWFSSYAYLINQGKIPYRDFYLYLTPLYPWILALFSEVFGYSFYGLRILGTLIILGIALTLFLILRKRFTSASSFAGASLAVIYYQSGVAHIPYDFTQVLTLFAVLAIYCLSSGMDHLNPRTKGIDTHFINLNFLYFFFAGVFGCLCFLTKQSNGAFISIGIFFAFVFIISQKSFSLSRSKSLLFFFFGALLPISFTLIYLHLNHASKEFIEQIFFSAIQAKGSPKSILFGWIMGMFNRLLRIQMQSILLWAFFLIAASYTLLWIIKKSQPAKNFLIKQDGKLKDRLSLLFFIISMGSIISLAWFDNPVLRDLFSGYGQFFIGYIIPLNFVWILCTLSLMIAHNFISIIPKPNSVTIVVAISTIGLILGNGTSAGLSEISTFMGVAWCIAWLCSKGTAPFLGIALAAFIYIATATNLIYSKFDSPYAWWGTKEPNARVATYQIDHPLLSGISVSKTTYDNFNLIINNLEKDRGKSIFSFPNIPIFYLLSETMPDSKVIVAWYDFLNDSHAEIEAERLEANPPDTIAFLDLPENVMAAHENLFRGGMPMGQRKIKNYLVKSCVNQAGYTIIQKLNLPDGATLYICNHKN